MNGLRFAKNEWSMKVNFFSGPEGALHVKFNYKLACTVLEFLEPNTEFVFDMYGSMGNALRSWITNRIIRRDDIELGPEMTKTTRRKAEKGSIVGISAKEI